MTNTRLSKKHEKSRKAVADESLLQEALEFYRNQKYQDPNHHLHLGYRPVAAQFGIPERYRSLEWRDKNARSQLQYSRSQQALSPQMERVLVSHILELADRAKTLGPVEITALANAILVGEYGRDTRKVTFAWFYGFLGRHQDIKMHWSKPLDMQRARALCLYIVKHWFEEIVFPFYVQTDIPACLTFNMDESAFLLVAHRRKRVAGRRGTKT
jgi:hypothetical protein